MSWRVNQNFRSITESPFPQEKGSFRIWPSASQLAVGSFLVHTGNGHTSEERKGVPSPFTGEGERERVFQ